MCGIFGQIGYQEAYRADEGHLRVMLSVLEHRGPDDEGLEIAGPVGLGNCRLKIFDLVGGHQPMVSLDGNYVLTFNGAIYNFPELCAHLAARGVHCVTRSDTEVLLHMLIEHGLEALPHLNGMFAFCFYDRRRRRALLARDRVGLKPLYLWRGPGALAFASEAKALLALSGCPRTVNETHLYEYLVFGFVAGPETLFAEIEEVLPGECVVVEGERITRRRYWTNVVPPRAVTEAAAIEELETLLADSIRLRCRSDVSVGILLSGGLDSTLVLTFARDHRPALEAVHMLYPTCGYDESAYLQTLTERWPIPIHVVELKDQDVLDHFEKVHWHFDFPVFNTNVFATYFLCQRARDAEITVLLTGDGGDELFGGYDRYAEVGEAWQRTRDDEVLTYARNVVALERIPRFYPGAGMRGRYRQEVTASTAGYDVWTRQLAIDQRTFLLPYLMRQDKMGMAHGIECRVPLLDHRIVEFANSLPGALKVSGQGGKHLLRRLGERRLPHEILQRPKQALTIFVADALRDGPLHDLFRALALTNGRCRRFFDMTGVEALLEEHRRGQREHTRILWEILTLEQWMRVMGI